MDWDKLRVFYAVAEAGSLTAAAESLHISQPALSRQIGALEDSVGVPLFKRHARGLRLTEQGKILHTTARDIIHKLTMVEGQLTDVKKLPEGPLTVTVSDFIGSTWLAPKLAVFQENNPNIQLSIIFEDRVLKLNVRQADISLRLGPQKDSDLIQKHLAKIGFHICGTHEYFQKNGLPQKPKDLKNHQLIGFPENTPAPFENPNWLFEIADIKLKDDMNLLMINSMQAIHRAVCAGAGIAVLPDYMIKASGLQVVLPEIKRPPVDMYMVYGQERRHAKRINLFREFLERSIRETPFMTES